MLWQIDFGFNGLPHGCVLHLKELKISERKAEVALYDYRCPECGFMDEVVHGMNESPDYECPECGVLLKRVYHPVHFSQGGVTAQGRVEDHLRREADMRQDLQVNHGIEKFVPMPGITTKDVYNDVKASGDYVKDQMQTEAGRAKEKRDKKQREWLKGAQRRAPARSREIVARKKAEQASSRAIRVST